MKLTLSSFAAAAIFSAAAFSSVAGTASAQSPAASPVAGPVAGRGDHETGLSGTPSQQKEWRARTTEAEQLSHDAAADLHAGRYVEAEAEARQSLTLKSNDGVPAEIFAESLERQGKDQEALQAYQTVVEHYDRNPRSLLPYALLLLKSGQWAQAVSVYNHTLLDTERNDLGKQLPLFSPKVLEPAALATAIHLERGDLYNSSSDWAGEPQNTKAMEEYTKALQLAPDSALTNYYYGVGWQRLTPAERAKFGTVQQAKAHLRKAEKVGNANIRAAAKKALKALG